MTVNNISPPPRFENTVNTGKVGDQRAADAVDSTEEVEETAASTTVDSVVAADTDNEIGTQLGESSDDNEQLPYELDKAPTPLDARRDEADDLGAISWGPQQRSTVGNIGLPNVQSTTQTDVSDSDGA